jgi:hypothetical protein
VDDQQNAEQPAPVVTEQTNDAVPVGPPITDSPKPKSSKKKLVIITVLALLLLGVSASAYFFVFKKDEPAKPAASTQTNQQTTTTETPKDPTRLIYAYREGKKTTVRELDTQTGTKKDIFSFDGVFDYAGNDTFSADYDSAVSMSPDQKNFLYIAATGINTREVGSGSVVTQIKISTEKNELGNLLKFDPAFTEQAGPKGLFGASLPTWSADSSTIGFIGGHYEGQESVAFKLKDKAYITATDTFVYIDETKIGEKLEVVSKNKALVDVGIFADRVFKPFYGIYSPVYGEGQKKVFAILCPENKPTTGDNQYIESAAADEVAQYDCAEPADSTVISASTTDGSYTKVGSGRFDNSLINFDDKTLYVAGKNSGKVFSVSVADKKVTEIDLSATAKLDAKSKLMAVRVQNSLHPMAVIYSELNGKYTATVIDIRATKNLGSFSIDKVSSFSVLGYLSAD